MITKTTIVSDIQPRARIKSHLNTRLDGQRHILVAFTVIRMAYRYITQYNKNRKPVTPNPILCD